MRKVISLSAVIVIAAVLAVAAPPLLSTPTLSKTVHLSWDYDTNNLPDEFNLYSSTDLNVPLTNWNLVATVNSNVQNVSISNLTPQQMWFYVTAKNWWGESPPSNLAGIPQPPSAVSNLRIQAQ